MRIDAYNQITQMYQANTVKKAMGTAKTGKSNDTVEISQAGKDYQVAKQAIATTSDVREDKVAEMKKALASGTYNVSSEEVANKLVESYFSQII